VYPAEYEVACLWRPAFPGISLENLHISAIVLLALDEILENEIFRHARIKSLISNFVQRHRELFSGQCTTALGMESGEIPDEDISASSMYDPSLGPKHARVVAAERGRDSARKRVHAQRDTFFVFMYVMPMAIRIALELARKGGVRGGSSI
ncbi:hypothetical protein ALC60_01725, partial [Trachymyrmex zeteki]